MTDIVERLRLLVPSDSSGAAFDAVNEIDRLTAERDRQYDQNTEQIERIAALEARVKELEEALQKIINLGGAYGSASYAEQADSIARAALTPQQEQKPRKKRDFVWPKGAPEDGR